VAAGFTGSWDATTGTLTSGTDDTVTTSPPGTSVNNWVLNYLNWQGGGNVASGLGLANPMSDILTFQDQPGGPYTLAPSLTSKTVLTLTQSGWNYKPTPTTPGSLHLNMSSGTFVITLTTPCTQADAVSAASPPGTNTDTDNFGTGGPVSAASNDTSLFESLILNGWSFLKVLLTFGFYLQGLIAGQNYVLTYLIYQRTASNDGSVTPVRGAWTLYATDTISFTASGATYSTATTYSLPNAVGYEYQVQFAYLDFA
jgi:hypothetical protein